MASSYLSTCIVSAPEIKNKGQKPGKKRKTLTEDSKDVKMIDINTEGAIKEIGSGVDDVSYGEDNNKNKAQWLKGLQDFTTGIDGMNPDYNNMLGNPHSSLPHFGVVTITGLLRTAIEKSIKQELAEALALAATAGIIPQGTSPNAFKIELPDGTKMTVPELVKDATEAQLKVAIKALQTQVANKPAQGAEQNIGAAATGAAGSIPPTNAQSSAGLPPTNSGTTPAANPDAELSSILSSMGNYEPYIKTAKKKSIKEKECTERFPLSGETSVHDAKRTMIEQLSDNEVKEISFHKTQIEPNEEPSREIEDGNGIENAETGFGGNPMYNMVYQWQ